ncbi:hypothetical protein BDZ89DRAFT_1081836 [Hymenopellis radicata]|nr:hypothetical protein BDZ89DRAFT_1081836 [Hymenopellis radicata]
MDELDGESLRVLQQILSDNESLLTPGLLSFQAKLKSGSSMGPGFTLPTPSSTPLRQRHVESDESDAEAESNVDSDASYDAAAAVALAKWRERNVRRAADRRRNKRRNKRRRLDSNDEEYRPERGRTAEAGQTTNSSCHRGGVVLPPLNVVTMNVEAGDHMNASPSSPVASSSNHESSASNGVPSSSSNVPSSGPYTMYAEPYLTPIKPVFLRAVARVAGQGLKLLEDHDYRATWVGDVLSGKMLAFGEGSDLAFVSNRCYLAEKNVACAQFARIIAMVALAGKIQSCKTDDRAGYLTSIWQRFVEPHNPRYTFNAWRRWHTIGVTWARWGQAGGVYLMLLVVHAKEVSAFEKASFQDISKVAYILRRLTEGLPISPLVRHIFRPLLDRLRQEFPLNTVQLLDANVLGIVKDNVDLQYWSSSDKFFGAFKMNSFTLPERIPLALDEPSLEPDPPSSIPTPPLTPASPYRLSSSPASPSKGVHWNDVLTVIARVQGPNHHKVPTCLNLALPQNAFTLRGASSSTTMTYTEKRRALASLALEPSDLPEFEEQLKKQLLRGYRVDPARYVLLDRHKLGLESDKFLHLMDIHNQPFAISLPPVPKQHRDNLMAFLEAAFPDVIQNQDSRNGTRPHRFHALHCTMYNRSARRGHDAPVDGVDDAWRMDKTGQKRSDIFQSMPRMAKEATSDERWDTLRELLQPISDFLTEQMRILIPDFTVLDAYIDFLPGCPQPSVYHFGGVVVNFNACSRGHRDHGDQNICLVLSAHEAGLVVRTYTGDSLVFQSCRITHFNLHYTGKRASIVFHSDRDGSAWAKDRNGWGNKTYFY